MIRHGNPRTRRKLKAMARPDTRRKCALDRGARVDWKWCHQVLAPAASHFCAAVSPIREFFRALVGTFQGRLRPWFCGEQWGWSELTKLLTEKLLSEKAFAGCGGEPAFVLKDAVM